MLKGMRFHLNQVFLMNRNYPSEGPNGIKPYISSGFVLIHEDGVMIPLGKVCNYTDGAIGPETVDKLLKLQSRGHQIVGNHHPGYRQPKDISGDMEYYMGFPFDSEDERALKRAGVKLEFLVEDKKVA